MKKISLLVLSSLVLSSCAGVKARIAEENYAVEAVRQGIIDKNKDRVILSAVDRMRVGKSASVACEESFKWISRNLNTDGLIGNKLSITEKVRQRGISLGNDSIFCVEPAQQKHNEEMDGLLDGSRPIKSCNDWSLTREDKGWINPKFYMRYNPLADDRQKVSFTGKIKSIEGNNIFVTHEKPEGHLAETLSYALGYGYVEGAAALVIFKKGNTYFTDVDRIVVGNYIKGVGISSGKTTASNAFGARTEIPVISAMCVE